MFQKLFYLQWKSFFRAAGVASNLAQKILIGFVWAYFAFVFYWLFSNTFKKLVAKITEPMLTHQLITPQRL